MAILGPSDTVVGLQNGEPLGKQFDSFLSKHKHGLSSSVPSLYMSLPVSEPYYKKV